jgi:hypothetical protein
VLLALLSEAIALLAELLSMKSVPASRVENHALDRQRRFAGLVEGQLELIAIEQVDTVVRSILRRGGDLVQDVVVLIDQVGTGPERNRIHHRRRSSQAVEGLAGEGSRTSDRADRRRRRFAGRRDRDLARRGVKRRKQIVRSELGVEVVQAFHRTASAVTERDVGGRAVAGGADRQGQAVKRGSTRLGDTSTETQGSECR